MPTQIERLLAHQQSEYGQQAEELDARVGELTVDWIGVALNVRSTDATFVGTAVRDLDIELRRASAIAFPTTTFFQVVRPGEIPQFKQSLPSPLATSQGRLEVSQAGTGSVDLWMDAAGAVLALLASTPVTGIANAVALMGVWSRIRVFQRRRTTPLDRLSAKDALTILRAFDHDPENMLLSDPEGDLVVGQGPYGHRRPRGYVTLPDGTTVNGRRISIIRRYPDGSSDFIHVD